MSNTTSNKMEVVDEETTKMVQETISLVKSQGVFDQFRKDCLADVDTKVAFLFVRNVVVNMYFSLFVKILQ